MKTNVISFFNVFISRLLTQLPSCLEKFNPLVDLFVRDKRKAKDLSSNAEGSITRTLTLFFSILMLQGLVAQQPIEISVLTPTTPITVDDSFLVTVEFYETNGAQNLTYAQVALQYDATVLEIIDVTAEDVTNLVTPAIVPLDFSTQGLIEYGAGVPPSLTEGIPGTFTFLTINFRAKATVTSSPLEFLNIGFQESYAAIGLGVIVSETVDGSISVIEANTPPTFNSDIADQGNNELENISLFVSATDDESPNLMYTQEGLPAGLEIDPNTGLITGVIETGASTGGLNNTGIYQVTITATDDGTPNLSDSQTFNWTIETETVETFTITVSQGANGTIAPGTLSVVSGGSQAFSITPDQGYEIDDVMVNGSSLGVVSSYEFTDVSTTATISATFKLATFEPIYVNCGGGEVTTSGITFVADTGFTGGTAFPNNVNQVNILAGIDFANTVDDELYRKERFGDYSYDFAVPNGEYIVDLYIAEIFQGVLNTPDNAVSGKRVFDVNIEGNAIELENFDALNPITGGAFASATAFIKSFVVSVTDGILNIETNTDIDNAKLSAIGIRANDGSANTAPSISTIDPIIIDQGDTIAQMISANDTDAISEFQIRIIKDSDGSEVQSEAYTLTPQGNTANFEWVTALGNDADYTATILAFDGKDVSSTAFSIRIGSRGNDAPFIDDIDDVEVANGVAISLPIAITDDTNTAASIIVYDKSINTTPNNTNTTPYTSGGIITGYTFEESPIGSGSYTLSFPAGLLNSRSYFISVVADDMVNSPVQETFTIDVAHAIPGIVDATTFSSPLPWYGNNPSAALGFTVSIENSGTNIGYIDAGDFVEYLINVPSAGFYALTFLSANGSNTGPSTDITFFVSRPKIRLQINICF